MSIAQILKKRVPIDPPAPLVTWQENHPMWLWQKVQWLFWTIVPTAVGVAIVAGLYYLLFQVNDTMNSWWHSAVSNDNLRHDIRDVGEGLLGGLLAQQVNWNHYRRRKPVNKLDRFEMKLGIACIKDDQRLSGWQLAASPFLVLIYAIPGFLVAFGVAYVIRHTGSPVHDLVTLHVDAKPPGSITHSLWWRIQQGWTMNWDKKLMGYSAAFFFGRRPAKGVFDDMQLWFAERRVARGKPNLFWHPPAFQARCNEVRAQGVDNPPFHSFVPTALMLSGVIVGFALAVYGWYVLTYIAVK